MIRHELLRQEEEEKTTVLKWPFSKGGDKLPDGSSYLVFELKPDGTFSCVRHVDPDSRLCLDSSGRILESKEE